MLFLHTNRCQQFTGKKQTGVAIITALLIVTLAATVSITISTQLQLDVRRTGNTIALDQADIYVSLTENIAKSALQNKDDFNNLMDALRTDGKFQVPFEINGGTTLAEITDLNSCININTLINTSAEAPTVDPLVQARLQRLFNNNGIQPAMITAMFDWMDTNSTAADFDIANGAEDGYYLNLETGYHTANRPLTSITEIRLIKGAETIQETPTYGPYNRINNLAKAFRSDTDNWPSLCAFDISNHTPEINVNTASRDVLLALSPTMTALDVDAIITCRGPEPAGAEIATMTDLTNCGGITNGIGTKITGGDRAQLVFTSDYFLLKTTVSLGTIKKSTYSIIFRSTTGATQIISRTQRTL